jgi:hypothetical protein
MTLLFCQRFLPEDKFAKCLHGCDTARTQNRYGSFGYPDVKKAMDNVEPESALKEALTFSASAAPLIADGLKGNPRQVKRFLNALLLRKELATVAKLENIKDAVLVKLMILEYVSGDLFSELFTWQSQQNGHPSQLAELEAALAKDKDEEGTFRDVAKKLNAKWDMPGMRRWVAMEPQLKEVDLRDYFWVARDRLESTFAGVAMIPPAVRQVLDGLMSGVAPKRNAAMETAKRLSTEERGILIQAIEQRVTRQPDEGGGYEALRYLIEAGIAEAINPLVEILTKRPLDKVPPAIGMQITTLYNAKPEHRTALEPILTHLSTSSTRVGKAYQESNKKK